MKTDEQIVAECEQNFAKVLGPFKMAFIAAEEIEAFRNVIRQAIREARKTS